MKSAANNEPPVNRLPASAMRLLYKAFVMAGPGVADEDMRNEYWKSVCIKWSPIGLDKSRYQVNFFSVLD